MIKAIIFDMDGVLVAAKDWHFEALNLALALFDCEIPYDEHLSRYDGLTTRKKLEMLTVEKKLPITAHDIIHKRKQEYTMQIIRDKCKPYPMHQETLFMLKNKGYQLALASNSIRNTIDLILEKTQLRNYLEEIISASDVIRPKPYPDIYQKVITKLKRLPNECLVIEDNINGVQAAEGAGAHILKVDEIDEVNLPNIYTRIQQIENIYETCEA